MVWIMLGIMLGVMLGVMLGLMLGPMIGDRILRSYLQWGVMLTMGGHADNGDVT